jgi:deazaflavin-dependent oxidoreductase (nitroreductase family)
MDSPVDPVPEAASRTPGEQATATPDAAPLDDPPALDRSSRVASDASRVLFRYANRAAMVPLHRAGLAAWLGNPLTGWQCLLTTTGRRSGLPRPVPLGYLVADGAAWVMAGYGPRTEWYRNIRADARVDLLLPGRPPIAALAEEVRDPAARARIIPPLCRSMALPGAMIGCFPPTSSDARILACVGWVPLIGIRPADGSRLVPGPDDPGGLAWGPRGLLALVATLAVSRAAVRFVRPLVRHAG